MRTGGRQSRAYASALRVTPRRPADRALPDDGPELADIGRLARRAALDQLLDVRSPLTRVLLGGHGAQAASDAASPS